MPRKFVPRPPSLALFLTFLAALGVVVACSVNPATGQRQVMLVSEAQEIQIGKESDPAIVATYGLVEDEGWQHYVEGLGREMARTSERPDLPWTFRVLDDPVVNAFALPGGYIYVTRGILAHFGSEAELASVLGHEIGHVTGRHGAERMSTAQLTQIGLGVAMIASEEARRWGALAQQGMGLLFLKFGRDDERQADSLGLRYLTRTGYDPHEMPDVFRTLERVSRGNEAGRLPDWLSTHPNPVDREQRIASEIAQLPPDARQGRVEADAYLRRLEGLDFGADPREGFFAGSTFHHPEMRFSLDVPSGWQQINRRDVVAAVSPQQDAIVALTLAEESSAAAAAQRFFAQQGVNRGQAVGPRAATFEVEAASDGSVPARDGLVAFEEHGGQVFQLLSYSSRDRWGGYSSEARRSVASFRTLRDPRYLNVEPKRVEIVRVPAAMTLQEFDRRYPSTVDLSTLATLNGMEVGDSLAVGRLAKRIVGGQLPEEAR